MKTHTSPLRWLYALRQTLQLSDTQPQAEIFISLMEHWAIWEDYIDPEEQLNDIWISVHIRVKGLSTLYRCFYHVLPHCLHTYYVCAQYILHAVTDLEGLNVEFSSPENTMCLVVMCVCMADSHQDYTASAILLVFFPFTKLNLVFSYVNVYFHPF